MKHIHWDFCPRPDPLDGPRGWGRGQNSVFCPEYGIVAYQIKGNASRRSSHTPLGVGLNVQN